MRLYFNSIFSNFSEISKYTIVKTFKRIDLFISIALILFLFVKVLLAKGDLVILMLAYLVIGSWHSVSMLVHVFTRTFTYHNGIRSYYHLISLIMVLSIPIGSLFIIIYLGPLFALFYTWLCYDELHRKMQRPLALLK